MNTTIQRLPTNGCYTNRKLEPRIDRLFETPNPTQPQIEKLRCVEWDYLCGELKMNDLEALEDELLDPLWSEYEHLINVYLNGDENIKAAVRKSDAEERNGLGTLKWHLGRSGANLTANDQKILKTNEEDQEYYEKKSGDMSNIRKIRGGRFKVTIQRKGESVVKTFDNLQHAQKYRDAQKAMLESQKAFL